MAEKILKYKNRAKGILQVDDEDADILQKSWAFDFSNRHRGSEYFRIKRAATKAEKEAGSTKHIKIYREVWIKHNGPIPEGFDIDHLDHNTLNNRKCNLALISHSENSKRIRRKFEPKYIRNKKLVRKQEIAVITASQS